MAVMQVEGKSTATLASCADQSSLFFNLFQQHFTPDSDSTSHSFGSVGYFISFNVPTRGNLYALNLSKPPVYFPVKHLHCSPSCKNHADSHPHTSASRQSVVSQTQACLLSRLAPPSAALVLHQGTVLASVVHLQLSQARATAAFLSDRLQESRFRPSKRLQRAVQER